MADATAELERASADIPLNKDARDVLERATALASDRGAAQAAPTDVLEAITADRGSSAYQAIKTLAGDPKAIDPHAAGVDGAPGLPLRQLLVNANREAQVLGHYQVDSMHLLLALMYSDARATSVALQKAGLTRFAPAEGAFYLYVDVSALTRDSVEFCQRLLTETGVAVTPGRDFDPIHGDSWIRLSFAGSAEDIAEACHRLATWLPKQ